MVSVCKCVCVCVCQCGPVIDFGPLLYVTSPEGLQSPPTSVSPGD